MRHRRVADVDLLIDDARVGAATRDTSVSLRLALQQTLELIQVPHPLDERPGSMMASGIDLFRKWCTTSEALFQAGVRPAALDDETEVLMYERIIRASSLRHTTTVNRVRTLLASFLSLQDAAHVSTPPSLALRLADYALANLDEQAALVILDVLLARYGTAMLVKRGAESATELFKKLLAFVCEGRGSVSRCSKLLVTFVAALRAQAGDGGAWLSPWISELADTMTHADDRACDNIIAHVVCPYLDWDAVILEPFLDSLASHGHEHCEGSTRAICAVLRAAKVRGLAMLVDSDESAFCDTPVRIPTAFAKACLSSDSTRIKVSAAALAIDAKTPAAPLTAAEVAVIQLFYTENLTLTSSVARKDTIASFVKLLVRVRINLHACAKRGADPATHARLTSLLTSLADAMTDALHPGAPYACTTLAVSLLLLLFEASYTIPRQSSADSAIQDGLRALQKAQMAYPGSFAIGSVQTSARLVDCLMHLITSSTYNDIQRTSAVLLARLGAADASLVPGLDTPDAVCERVVKESVTRMLSLKECDADAGVCLLQLYEDLFAVHKWPIAPALTCVASTGTLSLDGASTPPNQWTLLDAHVALLEARLQICERDGVEVAAQAFAMHGCFAALVHLLEASHRVPHATTDRLLECVRRVSHVTLPVLCAAAPEGTSVPDDEPQQTLLDALQEVEDEETSLQAKHQLVLSFSWRAMKEAAQLEAAIACRAVRDADLPRLQQASDLFSEWLLSVRHRGAFSTIYPCYQTIAASALRSKNSDIAALPRAWLTRLLSVIDERCESTSTTRRSAGLGYVVLALVSAFPPKTVEQLLRQVLCKITSLCEDSTPTRTTHALNIVRVLTIDRALTGPMRAHMGKVLKLAVLAFRATDWRVRNAAMLLFAAICSRHFGTDAFSSKAEKVTGHKAAYLDDIIATHEDLADKLADTLARESCAISGGSILSGHDSALYAVLLLLSRSRPGGRAFARRDGMLEAIERCARSAYWQIRTQVARCYAVLLRAAERRSAALRFLEKCSLRNQNALHGYLCIVHALAEYLTNEERAQLLPHVCALSADLLLRNTCPATVATYLNVVCALSETAPGPPKCVAPIRTWINASLSRMSGPQTPGGDARALVNDPFVTCALPSMLTTAAQLGDSSEQLAVKCTSLLMGTDAVKCAAIDFCVYEMRPRVLNDTLVSAMLDVVLDKCAPLSARIAAAVGSEEARCAVNLESLLAQESRAQRVNALVISSPVEELRAATLVLLAAACNALKTSDAFINSCITIWDMCSREDQTVASRLSTARALRHARGTVLSDSTSSPARFGAQRIVYRLLSDDDVVVRQEAAAIASSEPPARNADTSSTADKIMDLARCLPRSCDDCADLMLEAMFRTDAKLLALDLWRLLSKYALPEAPADSREAAGEDTHALFPSETANQFYDPRVHLTRAYKWLMSGRLSLSHCVSAADLVALRTKLDTHADSGDNTQAFAQTLLTEILSSKLDIEPLDGAAASGAVTDAAPERTPLHIA